MSAESGLKKAEPAVTAAHAKLNRAETALDWYVSDHGVFPATISVYPGDPLALLAGHQLRVLTNPVAYLNLDCLCDPLRVIESHFNSPALPFYNDFPKLVRSSRTAGEVGLPSIPPGGVPIVFIW